MTYINSQSKTFDKKYWTLAYTVHFLPLEIFKLKMFQCHCQRWNDIGHCFVLQFAQCKKETVFQGTRHGWSISILPKHVITIRLDIMVIHRLQICFTSFSLCTTQNSNKIAWSTNNIVQIIKTPYRLNAKLNTFDANHLQ